MRFISYFNGRNAYRYISLLIAAVGIFADTGCSSPLLTEMLGEGKASTNTAEVEASTHAIIYRKTNPCGAPCKALRRIAGRLARRPGIRTIDVFSLFVVCFLVSIVSLIFLHLIVDLYSASIIVGNT